MLTSELRCMLTSEFRVALRRIALRRISVSRIAVSRIAVSRIAVSRIALTRNDLSRIACSVKSFKASSATSRSLCAVLSLEP
jgi:hypothetical protein